jgi:DNA-binding NtrC family response regulator
MAQALLQDRRVLVVEDEYMIAEAMSRGLRRAGAAVLGPVANVDAALALMGEENDIDAAVLDINLGDQKVYPVVDALRARGASCVFATGNDAADVPIAYRSVIRCEKPVDPACIVDALARAVAPDVQARRQAPLADMRLRLVRFMEAADRAGETLLAVKLCETLDVLDDVLAR